MRCGMGGPEPRGKIQVSVSLLPEQLKRVLELAAARRTSRNALLRYVVQLGLEALEREEQGRKP